MSADCSSSGSSAHAGIMGARPHAGVVRPRSRIGGCEGRRTAPAGRPLRDDRRDQRAGVTSKAGCAPLDAFGRDAPPGKCVTSSADALLDRDLVARCRATGRRSRVGAAT